MLATKSLTTNLNVVQRQGTYKCPKCGSTDSYDGTALVNAGGIGIAREIGDSGAYVGASSSSTRERTVRKCRSCGEILGKKDYVPSASEREVERQVDQIDQKMNWVFGFGFVIAGGYIGGHWDIWDGGSWDKSGAFVAGTFSIGKMLIGAVAGGVARLLWVGWTSQSD